MSRRPVRQLLADIVERIDRISSYLAGVNREAFLTDQKTSDAVVRSLEIIGEAANRLPETFTQRFGDVPWTRIVGLRNRIVHGYFDVDLELVWEIITVELPGLKTRIEDIARTLDQDVERDK